MFLELFLEQGRDRMSDPYYLQNELLESVVRALIHYDPEEEEEIEVEELRKAVKNQYFKDVDFSDPVEVMIGYSHVGIVL